MQPMRGDEPSPPRFAREAGTERFANVTSQLPIAFPLRFTEKLLQGGFLREIRVSRAVVRDVEGLVAGQAGFEHQQIAQPAFATFARRWIFDLGEQRMRLWFRAALVKV